MPTEEEVKRNGNRRKNTASKWTESFRGFVDIPLSDADRQILIDLFPVEPMTYVTFLADLMQEGYKFSLTEDRAHGCVIATATGKSEGNKNEGLALSARGPGVEQAMLALRYKMGTLARWGAWTSEEVKGSTQLTLWG